MPLIFYLGKLKMHTLKTHCLIYVKSRQIQISYNCYILASECSVCVCPNCNILVGNRNIVSDSSEILGKVEVNDIHCPPLILPVQKYALFTNFYLEREKCIEVSLENKAVKLWSESTQNKSNNQTNKTKNETNKQKKNTQAKLTLCMVFRFLKILFILKFSFLFIVVNVSNVFH